MNIPSRIDLPLDEIPTSYYNILADFKYLPKALAPPLHPATKKPVGPEDLKPLFPMELIKQEVSTQRFIPIPEEVLEVYRRYRPSPLYRAKRLEKELKTAAKIFYKYEGVSPPGSHKPNTAIAQAYYNAQEGVEKLITETGAGQWGTALAYAGQFFDLAVEVYMVRISYDQKPFRRTIIELYSGEIYPSPSDRTEFGRKVLKENPDHPGTLGIAISEAIERVVKTENSKYSLGSVLNHVLLHQTIIGLETQQQFAKVDLEPDIVIGCFGGGSNFAGLSFPYIRDKLQGKKKDQRIIAVESSAAPKLTRGEVRYDFGDTAGMTPLLRMHTIGHDYVPPPVHAGGLRYHGAAPAVSHLVEYGMIESESYTQLQIFDAADLLAKTEGLVAAPESAHAVAAAIHHAKSFPEKNNKEGPVIVFNLSGHGLLDLVGFKEYLAGQLVNYELEVPIIKKTR
ncbi:MAG: TrpB-like pyridoxal phosphate-dependent enzyme [Candidatus Hodarchaeales archaeon]|jgi:tryptophan synthase beta chain